METWHWSVCLHYHFTTCIDDVPTPHRELQQTIMSVNTIEEEKESLFKATEELQTTLEVSFAHTNDGCAYTHIWACYHIHIGSFLACVCVAWCFHLFILPLPHRPYLKKRRRPLQSFKRGRGWPESWRKRSSSWRRPQVTSRLAL